MHWRRALTAGLAVALCSLGLGCDKAAEPEKPAKQGNIEAGRPAKSKAGQYVEEAKKAKEAINARPGQLDDGARKSGAE